MQSKSIHQLPLNPLHQKRRRAQTILPKSLVVDLLGLLLIVVVTSAAVQGSDGAQLALAPLATGFPRLRTVFADLAYRGPALFDGCWKALRRWRKIFLWVVEKTPGQKGF